MKVFIYDLSDPRTGEVRYIGKSVNPRERLATHIRESRNGSKLHSRRWIAGIIASGGLPILGTLEISEDAEANNAERLWIASFKLMGARLTNRTFGGDGQSQGYMPSQETRDKISRSLTGRKNTSEQNARLKKAFNEPSVREKRRTIATARMADQELRAVAARGRTGQRLSEETKAKMSTAWTPERKAAHAAEKSVLPVDDRWRDQLRAALKTRWDKYRASA